MSDSLKLPYPGLRPFDERDGPIFFGRQTQIAVLIRRLEKYRFVAVIGSSGSGKSSLVRAGLLPAIKRGFLLETTKWLPVVIRPGGDPYRALADEFLKLRPQIDEVSPAEEFDKSFRKTLRLTDTGLVKALPTLGLDPETHFLIIIDQFEELFSFRSAMPSSDDRASRDEASAFVSMLLNAFREQDAKIWVILTMRSDFIGNCEAFLGLPESVSQSQFLVPRLDSGQMEEAIVRPGLVTGAEFEPFTVPRELANIIINEAGDRTDQLPLMQHALMRTWKNAVAVAKPDNSPILLTESNYNDVGGIKSALNRDADAAWQSLKSDRQLSEICRKMFLLLCDVLPGGRILRRRPRMSEVMKVTGASEEQIKTVLRVFQQDDRNFLLPSVSTPFDKNAVLDITHETLFRQWHEIQRWIQRESESLANYQDLLKGAKRQLRQPDYRLDRLETQRLDLWRVTDKPTEAWAKRYGGEFKNAIGFLELCRESIATDEDRRKRKRKYQVVGVLGLLLLVAAASTSFAWFQINTNHQLRRDLKIQEKQSKRLQNEAESSIQKNIPTAQFDGLRLATRSLRVYGGNRNSQQLLCQLLLENRWCLPTTPTLTSDIVADKYFLAATLSVNKKTMVIVTQEGTLLRWDGHSLDRRFLSAKSQVLPGVGTAGGGDASFSPRDDANRRASALSPRPPLAPSVTPANPFSKGDEEAKTIFPKVGEAFFSDDGRYLVTTPFDFAPKKPPVAVKNETDAQLYIDVEGNGDYRPLRPINIKGGGMAMHMLTWSPRNNYLVVTAIDWLKPDQSVSQLFEKQGDDLQPTDVFDNLQISAACFSSDGKQLFTSTPPTKVNSDTETGQSAKILKWNISYEGSKPKISPDTASFDLPRDYQKPFALSCNADGTYLAAIAWGSPAAIVETKSNEVKSFYLPDGSQIMRVSFSPSEAKDVNDLMLVSTIDRIGFWKASQLKRADAFTYTLGEPWCEPIVFQGMAAATFVDNGAMVMIVSGGSFKYYEYARAFEVPINEKIGKWDDRQFSTDGAAPDWLLDLASVLSGSGREPEGDTGYRPTSISDVYGQSAASSKINKSIYQTLREKFSPINSKLGDLSRH